jgi:hypothetical protein
MSATTKDRSDDIKHTLYMYLECVFDQFLKYHVKILLNFSANLGRENMLKLTVWNEGFHEINEITNDNAGLNSQAV